MACPRPQSEVAGRERENVCVYMSVRIWWWGVVLPVLGSKVGVFSRFIHVVVCFSTSFLSLRNNIF